MLDRETLAKGVEEAQRRAVEALGAGWSFVRGSVASLPLFAGLKGATQGAGEELRDETHYFLVPYRIAASGYALYSIRRIPEGYAEANALPHWRIFHLPGPGAEPHLEALAVQDLAARRRAALGGGEAPLADRLNRAADAIDEQSDKVTGGLLLIGGAVAVANPLLGVGIAAQALWPSLGSELSKEGLKYAAEKLRTYHAEKAEAAHQSAAAAEVRTWQVRAVVNPLLATLEKALNTSERQYDPLAEYDFAEFRLPGWSDREMLILTARVVHAMYAEVLEVPERHAAASLGPEDVRWLRTFAAFADAPPAGR